MPTTPPALHSGHTYLRVTTATPASVSPTLPLGLALAYRGPIGELPDEHVFEVTPTASTTPTARSVPGAHDPNANTVSYARGYGNAYQDTPSQPAQASTTESNTRAAPAQSQTSTGLSPDGPGWAAAKDGVVAAVRGVEGVKGVEVLQHRQRAKRTEF